MKKIIFLIQLILLTTSVSAQEVEEAHPVVILGAGTGGLTSATYLCRAGVTPLVLTGPTIGGAIAQSPRVENWPGEVEISGIELSEKMEHQAKVNGADLRMETVVSVDFSQRPFLITTKSLIDPEQTKRYKTDCCIIATGATPNLLQIPGESKYWSKGVYNCAVCDGGLYKGKIVAVVGGGDAALIEAQYLANLAREVHLIVRKDKFRSVETKRIEQILSHPNIHVHYGTIVREVKGDGTKVTHILLQTNGAKQEERLDVDALFLAIGSQPNTQLFKEQLEVDAAGYIALKRHQETSLEGVYAIGDVADPEFKQAVSAAGDGAKAALQAQIYLASLPKTPIAAIRPLEVSQSPKKEVISIDTVSQLEAVLKKAKGPVFVDFYADYCGPCRRLAPLYAGWAQKYGDKVTFLKVDASSSHDLCEKFQIRALPTLIIFDEKGQIIQRTQGLNEIGNIEKRLEQFSLN